MRTRRTAALGLAITLAGCQTPTQPPQAATGATRGQETAPPAHPTPTTCEAPCTPTHTTTRTSRPTESVSAPAPSAANSKKEASGSATAPPAPAAVTYSREQFGSGWADPDHNGCDARQDAVKRATSNRVYDGKCRIVVADVYDRYSGRTYPQAKTSSFDIDHVVSLHDAWQSGAWKWTRAKRVAYANDPSVLVLTTASANRSKSDQGPDTWSPVSHDGACWYVKAYRNIKRINELHTTAKQRAAIRRTLTTC